MVRKTVIYIFSSSTLNTNLAMSREGERLQVPYILSVTYGIMSLFWCSKIRLCEGVGLSASRSLLSRVCCQLNFGWVGYVLCCVLTSLLVAWVCWVVYVDSHMLAWVCWVECAGLSVLLSRLCLSWVCLLDCVEFNMLVALLYWVGYTVHTCFLSSVLNVLPRVC